MAHNIVLGVNIHAHYLQTQTIARNIFIQYAFNSHRNHVNQTLSIISKCTLFGNLLYSINYTDNQNILKKGNVFQYSQIIT